MTKINYKSDFDFILRLKDGAGHDLGFPDYGWEAMFWTSSKASPFKASCFGGVCKNCYDDEGQIHIVADNHNLGIGTLKVEFRAELPREIYPDDYQRNVMPEPLGIELIKEKGELPSEIEAELLLPYIKGEPFTYEDFTAEEIKELQQPATQAAEELKEFQTEAEAKESEREVAETKRISAEELRESAEAQRASAEASRESTEDTRVSHETTRCSSEESRSRNEVRRCDFEKERVANEKARVSAEESRAQAETSRVSAEQSRATAETARQGNETTRSTNEQSRVSAEETRISNEQTRTSAETSRASAEQTRATNEQSRQSAETARVSAEQSRATEFAGFADTIAAKQDKLTTSKDLSISAANELSLTDSAKRAVFNDMFNLAAGSDGGYKPSEAPDPAKPYLLNTLWLSYEEAVKVYAINGADAGRQLPNIGRRYSHYYGAPLVNSVRTLFKVCGHTQIYGMFFGATKLEVVNVDISGNLAWVFRGNSKLKTVLGTVEISEVTSGDNLISDCALLEDVNLKGLRNNIRMRGCPKLSLATMQYLVDNASTAITAEKPVVVTVHADVFAKLTGDMTNEAAAALTDDEKTAWAAVLTAATSKYISFATD